MPEDPDNQANSSGTNGRPSGSRLAPEGPGPAPSGTSGRVLGNSPNLETLDVATTEATDTVQALPPPSLPDRPDMGASVPDRCRTPAGHEHPYAGQEGAAAGDAGPEDPVPSPDADATARQLIVSGVISIGRMRDQRESFNQHRDPDLRELLGADQHEDTIIEADAEAKITILDLDVHHLSDPPSASALEAHLQAISPPPDAAWTSHGDGLKLVYVGPHHADRASAAAFSVPQVFHVEHLSHTRHPRSRSSAHLDAVCGPVIFFETDPNARFEFRGVGRLTPELRVAALEGLGLEDGGHYDHDRCPIDPDAASDASDCVVVLEHGVYCHRCAGHGVCYRPSLRPGYVPFGQLVSPTTDLDELVAEAVHWTHARLHLMHAYPNLSGTLLEQAYRRALEARWEANDPRIRAIFNSNLDFIWGEGLWLDSVRLTPTKVDNDAVSGLPYCQYVVSDDDGNLTANIDYVRRSQVKNRTPRGYRPVRPVRGIGFARHDDVITVVAPPGPRYPIVLLDDPLAEDAAFQTLELSFPRLDRRYLNACLAAAICADARRGQPPMLTCSGPSGTGKEQHIRLAASFLGQEVVKLSLSDTEAAFRHQIGVAVTTGSRFLAFDEFGKTQNLIGKIKPILEISETVHWRPLYANHFVKTDVRAAFVFPCVSFPQFLLDSQEFNRRTRHMHLHYRLPNWKETSGGDTAEWRNRTEANAYVANSLLTHVVRLCNEHQYQFDS
jgi:hypothetical protein